MTTQADAAKYNISGTTYYYIDIVGSSSLSLSREFDTLKSKKVPQSLEIGLFFCQIFIFII